MLHMLTPITIVMTWPIMRGYPVSVPLVLVFVPAFAQIDELAFRCPWGQQKALTRKSSSGNLRAGGLIRICCAFFPIGAYLMTSHIGIQNTT
jgi:hypothetical protein